MNAFGVYKVRGEDAMDECAEYYALHRGRRDALIVGEKRFTFKKLDSRGIWASANR